MALTKIRGTQIQDLTIGNSHINPSNPIAYSNLSLNASIIASDLSTNHSVHTDVLDYKLFALWDLVQNLTVAGTSTDVTSEVQAAALVDTATNTGTAKGVLTTGTGPNGAGIENYKVQIRNSITKDPIADALGGTVYGELTYNGGTYLASYKNSDDTSYTMGASETCQIVTEADVSRSLATKYFTISSPTEKYSLRFIYIGDEPGMELPIPGYTSLYALINISASANDVAAAIRTALNAVNEGTEQFPIYPFAATGTDSPTIGITIMAGLVLESLRNGSGNLELPFAFSITAKGTPTSVDFMFQEVYSLNTAPLRGFVSGIGFSDIVSTVGTHNHNDLYYSKSELDSGQLDDRYFTKTAMSSGALDTRYYTESELDNGQLDSRYYTESELGSTVEGSSGASRIGISAIAGVAAGTVQGAIAELQSDIASLDSSVSLDDAYNNGSAITVDTTDVAFNLSDGRLLKVTSDSGATNVLSASAGAGGDSVVINGSLDVNGGALELDGTSASHVNTTGANLTVSTTTSGDLAISSAGSLTLKDSNLTAGVPVSQTGVTGLSSNLNTATSIIGAINENTDDLYTLINTTLPDTTDGSSGADGIGVTGIAGVIPTGGSLGSNASVQAMLEGIAANAGSGKTYPTTGVSIGGEPEQYTAGSFLQAKNSGTYFKIDELVFITDINRFIRVLTQNTQVVENTDYAVVGSNNSPIVGNAIYLGDSATTANTIISGVNTQIIGSTTASIINGTNQITVGDSNISIDGSATSGGSVIAKAPTVNIGGGSATPESTLVLNATSINLDAPAITADAALNGNITLTTTGTGQTQLASANEIDLTSGAIDINATAAATINSDSLAVATVHNIDIIAGPQFSTEPGHETDPITSTGTINLNGVLIQSKKEKTAVVSLEASNVSGIYHDDNTNQSYIRAGGECGLEGSSTSGINLHLQDSSSQLNLSSNNIYLTKTNDGGDITIEATGNAIDTNAAEVTLRSTHGNTIIGAGNNVNITASNVNISGTNSVNVEPTADGDVILTTTGEGTIYESSEKQIDLNAPFVNVEGNLSMPSNAWLNVGNIKINSVNPLDKATISGSRFGTENPLNKLSNPGFELGTAADADNWTEGTGVTRVFTDQYYGSYSMKVALDNVTSDTVILTQALTGLTANTAHNISIYVRGATIGGKLQAQLNGGAVVDLVATAGTINNWTRYNANTGTDNAADGNFNLIVTGTGTENYDFYIDAVMINEGTGVIDYFSASESELRFTIGNGDQDRIVFKSSGTATKDLVRINQNTVEILGDLLVSGTTTTVNSEDMLIADNQIVLNSNVTGAPSLDAFLRVERGTSDDAVIRWNESTDAWEIGVGTTYTPIATGGTVTMDGAYNGGSSVTVDATDVNFQLAATKSFIISDASDTNKFAVTAGSGASSIKIDTIGGVDIDTDAGFTIDDDSGAFIRCNSNGKISISSPLAQEVAISSANGVVTLTTNNGNINLLNWSNETDQAIQIMSSSGGIDIDTNITSPITIDSGSFSIDGVLASNVSTTGANLTLSTITSGNLILASAGAATVDGTSFSIDATGASNVSVTGANLTLSTITSGNLNLTSAGEIYFDDSRTTGAIPFSDATHTSLPGSTTSILEALNTAYAANSSTFDDIYNNESVDHVIVVDSGDMQWNLSDTYQFNIMDDAAATILSVQNNTTSTDISLNTNVVQQNGTVHFAPNGTTANAFQIDTTGGVDIDVDAGLVITDSRNGTTSLTIGDKFINLNAPSSGEVVVGTISSGLEIISEDINLFTNNTTDDAIVVNSFAGGIDINAASTKPITLDSGSFSIDGVLASNVSVTGAALTLSTITSGNLNLTAAGSIVGTAGTGNNISLTTTSSGIIQLTSAQEVEINGGSVDINTTEGFALDDSSGSYIRSSAGTISIASATSQNITIQTITDGVLQLLAGTGTTVIRSTGNTTNTAIEIESLAGGIDINAAATKPITLDSGSFSIDGVLASNVTTTGAALTLSTATSGNLNLSSAGELVFTDSRIASIEFTDTSNTTLPGGATSIVGALNAAYNHVGTTISRGYQEITATTTDVTNDYVVSSITLFPTSGTFPMSPSALRALSDQVHAVVYLNGLRLSDTEWRYTYDSGSTERRITFDGSNNITLVAGDIIMVDVEKFAV